MRKKLLLLALISSSFSYAEEFSGGPLSDYAKEVGATGCYSEIFAIDKFLNGKAGANGAWTSAAKDNGSGRIYTGLNIKKYNDGTWGYATVNVAPGANNSCDGTLMQLVTFPNKSCNAVRETTYKDYKYAGELAGKAIYESGSAKAVLEELTGSCIAIRYEAMYPVPK